MTDQPPIAAPWMNPAARKMLEDVLAGQLRHVLTGMAGGLAAYGLVVPNQTVQDQVIQFVTASIIYAVPAAWSWWSKTGREQFIARVAKLKFEADEKARKAAQSAADHKTAEVIVSAVNQAVPAA